MPTSPSAAQPGDFSAFGTAAMTPDVQPTQLPAVPKPKRPAAPRAAPAPNADSVEAPSNDELPKIERSHPATMPTQPAPAGDEEMELDPYESFPIPSTPHQGTPGDERMEGPEFSHGVRQASLQTATDGYRQAPADVRAAIEKVAAETGASVPYLLATAQRESSFDPNAGGSGSISGLWQATGGLRRQYGIEGDAEAQTRGYAAYLRDMRRDMGQRMGRAPTDAETYLGHHFGPARGAGIASGAIAPDTPVDQVFTPNELRLNPHIARAGTVGQLRDTTIADMERRMRGFGPSNESAKSYVPQNETDFSKFGSPQGVMPADWDATALAQVPPVMTGAWRPKNQETWDAAVADMQPSENIDDRRGEDDDTKARNWANAEMGRHRPEPEISPNQRVEGGFAMYGTPLAREAGLNNIDQPQPGGRDLRGAQGTAKAEPRPQRMQVGPYEASEPTSIRQTSPDHVTRLPQLEEMAFRQWVKDNKVPFDPDAPNADYDMRGFYRALQQGDPRAAAAVNPNDNRLHFPDTWKTPQHQSFSADSQYANPNGPQWTGDDKLVSPGGRVLLDERAKSSPTRSDLPDLGIQQNALTDFFGRIMGTSEPPAPTTKAIQGDRSSTYPTADDAAFARKYDYAYGTPYEPSFNNQTAIVTGQRAQDPRKKGNFVPTSASGMSLSQALDNPAENVDLTDPRNAALRQNVQDLHARAALAVQRDPIATLGYAPSHTKLDAVMKNSNVGGLYSGNRDQIWATAADVSGLAHESIHRGLEQLRQRSPEARAIIDKMPFGEEDLVRYIMATTMGNPEAGTGDVSDSQRKAAIFTFDKSMRTSAEAQKVLARLREIAADEIAKKRPMGPR